MFFGLLFKMLIVRGEISIQPFHCIINYNLLLCWE